MRHTRWTVLSTLGLSAACGTVNFDPRPGPVLEIAAGAAHTCALLAGGRVRCWGFNGNGELGRGAPGTSGEGDAAGGVDIDIGGTVSHISAGAHHTCALLGSGTVRCWGANASGQLGYGNTSPVGDTEPPAAAGDVDVGGTVVQIAAGESSTCALLDTGAVRCWGDNSAGQLGHGNTTAIGDDETPATAGDIDLGGAASQIAVGSSHACALLSTGTLRCWGSGGSGKLGYGNTATVGDNETPASAGDVPVGGRVTQITAGAQHTCALLASGSVRCWGPGADGRLGYANTSNIGDNETPDAAGDLELGDTAIQIAGGGKHTCAVLTGGQVVCWGSAQQGQLGYGNVSDIGDNETPSAAGEVDVGGAATQVATGVSHTCAVVTGQVRCWGAAAHGRLGHGGASIVIGDDETPASQPVVQLGGTAERITAGADHVCALLTGGDVVCWGSNGLGQSGNPARDAIGDDETPAAAGPIALGPPPAVDVEAGADHTCALLTGGAIRCWGNGGSGRLGYGNTLSIGNNETPASALDVNVGSPALSVALGTNHTCAVITGGAVRCWGNNARGQLGYGNTASIGDDELPVKAGNVDVGDPVTQLALGNAHTCALTTSATVRCWGDNATGVLGYGNTKTVGDDERPSTAAPLDFGGNVTQIAYSGSHGCARLDDGSVNCWGSGTDGQLGRGNTSTVGDNETPALAGKVDVGGSAVKVATGTNHSCALLTGGAVRCWGRGSDGRLGYGNTLTIGDNEPALAPGTVDVGGTAIDIAAGGSHTCVILSDKTVRCWGDDRGFGLLGQAVVNNIGDNETPASIDFVAVP